MPWTQSDAHRHTHKATSGKAARQWAHVANGALERGASEGQAIREANGVVRDRGSHHGHKNHVGQDH